MAVLSIRKYLTDGRNDGPDPLLHLCLLLLEGIAKHAVAFDREEYGEFRETLRRLASVLKTTRDANELLSIGNDVNSALDHYNREAQRVYAAQTVELRCMIEMLSQTLEALAAAGGHSVQTLQTIRNQIESARQLEDVRLVRARLGDSLKSLSDEARRQRDRNSAMLRHAQEATRTALSILQDVEVDRVTGLPTPQRAEREMTGKLDAESPSYAAVFVATRLDILNVRYGHAAGDRLLQFFGRLIASNAPSDDDKVFRWRGPAFVLVIDRDGNLDAVRAETARLLPNGQEHPIEVDGRTIRLPLSYAWTVLPLAKFQSAAELYHQIDHFVADQGQSTNGGD